MALSGVSPVAQQRDALGGEAEASRPAAAAAATSPAALWPKRKFSPTITPEACSRSTRALWTNSSGRQPGELEGERQRAEHVDAELLRPARPGARSWSAPAGGCRAAPPRTGAARRSAARWARRARCAAATALADDLGVAAVDAVEDADRDDAVPPPGGYRVEPAPALHARSVRSINPVPLSRPGRRRPRGGPGRRPRSAGRRLCHPGRSPPWVPTCPRRASAGRTTVPVPVVGHGRTGIARAHRVGQRQRHRIVEFGELSERACLGQLERPDPGAAQSREVPAYAERRAEIAGQRPHVGARRALDLDVDVEQIGGRDAARRRLERLTVTGRAASSTDSPSRTRLYARSPSTLIADTALGTCMISPVSGTSAARTCASPTRAAEATLTSRPRRRR